MLSLFPTCSDEGKVEVKSILNLVSVLRSILSALLESSKQVVSMKLWPVSDMTVTTCVQFFTWSLSSGRSTPSRPFKTNLSFSPLTCRENPFCRCLLAPQTETRFHMNASYFLPRSALFSQHLSGSEPCSAACTQSSPLTS